MEQQAFHVENHTALNVGKMYGYFSGERAIDSASFQKFLTVHEVSVM